MSLDWTDEAWRERWAELARQRAAERAAHQAEVDRWMAELLKPVVFEQIDLSRMTIQQAADYFGYDVSQDGASLVFPLGTVYSPHAGGPDLTDHVPDPAAPDRDPG